MRAPSVRHQAIAAQEGGPVCPRRAAGVPARGGRRRRERGLTLIEISIAIAIVAVLFAAVVMGVGAVTGAKAKKAATELAGTIRSLYDEAALSGRTCRLAFLLPDERDEEGQVHVRAECAERAVTSMRDRDQELEDAEERLREAARERERGFDPTTVREARSYSLTDMPSLDEVLRQEEERVENAAKFSQFTHPAIPLVEIPEGVQISVWTKNQRKVASGGVAYLYFYPQGYTERAMVFVSQGDNAWTIKVSPLTGKAEIVPELLEVPD